MRPNCSPGSNFRSAQSYNSLMQRLFSVLLVPLCSVALRAEVHVMTLRQAVDRALQQNPDIALARLDEQKAQQAVRLTKAPFSPRIDAGSGLAYSSGFPMSIEGAAPSIVQARATAFVFNRQQSYLVAAARENARGASIATSSKRDEVAFRTASLYLDAQRAARLGDLARKEIESIQKVQQTVNDRVKEGRELAMEGKRAALNVARAQQRIAQLTGDQEATERSLAVVLGFSADDQVHATDQAPATPMLPPNEDAAIQSAIESSKELKRLQSAVIAKGLDVRAQRAARLPRVDLVAQYALFAKFNNYENFFRTFERNNGQIGMSFQLPILAGPSVSAAAAQAEAEAAHLRLEMNAARNRIMLDTRQSFQNLKRAQTARDVAQLDLELSRDQLSILLAKMNEGRVSMQQVEQARFEENEKWIAFYDAQYTAEKEAWDVLRQTGDLMAALQ